MADQSRRILAGGVFKTLGSLLTALLMLLVHILPLSLLMLASVFGIFFLWQKALLDPRFSMGGETLSITGSARECPESLADFKKLGQRFDKRNLLDPALLSDIRLAYAEVPWVKRIVGIRRMFPNRVEVEFLLRIPVAQVKYQDQYWLIDYDAFVLPTASSKKKFSSLPEITGATPQVITDKPVQGKFWNDTGISGALGIMRAFWASPMGEILPVKTVIINGGTFSDALRREQFKLPRYEIETFSGALVRWGTFNPGVIKNELTTGEKLWNLQELVRREEALKPGICFDVRTKISGYSL